MLKANVPSIPRAERALRRANCLSSDAVGDCVRITGPKVGTLYQVTKVAIATVGNPPAVGIITKKHSATLCVVQFHGPMKGVYSSLTPNQPYFAGTDSRLAKVGDLTYPSGLAYFQQIAVALHTDEVFVNPLLATYGPGGGLVSRMFRQSLSGAINGVNSVFLSSVKFSRDLGQKESLYLNGVLLEDGAGNDYDVTESVPTTGYDTVTLAGPPKAGDKLTLDFVPFV